MGAIFNVIPADIDCYSSKAWADNALFQPEPRQKFAGLLKLGYVDAFRHFNSEPDRYTFWDYFRNHWQNNRGIRIDHFLVAPTLVDRMTGCLIDMVPRGAVAPSDHTPIALALAEQA